jgi:hypothetical protein
VIADFMESIREGSLHRKPNDLHRQTAVIWNEVAREFPELGLRPVSVPSFRPLPRRVDWALLTESFRQDVEDCLAWSACTDPFAADARSRPLAPSKNTTSERNPVWQDGRLQRCFGPQTSSHQ